MQESSRNPVWLGRYSTSSELSQSRSSLTKTSPPTTRHPFHANIHAFMTVETQGDSGEGLKEDYQSIIIMYPVHCAMTSAKIEFTQKIHIFKVQFPNMEQFNNVFQHDSEHHIIICKSHQYAVNPQQTRGHLQKSHPGIFGAQRQAICRFVDELTDVAQEPSKVVCPLPTDQPIDGLPVYFDGLQCLKTYRDGSQCQHICRGRSSIERHWQTEHRWTNSQQRGGSRKRTSIWANKYRSDQACQQIFTQPKWPHFVRVTAENPSTPNSSQKSQVGDSILDEYQRELDAKRATRRVEGDVSRFVPNAWLAFTGWPNHLAQFESKQKIIAYVQPDPIVGEDEEAEEEEEGLEDACRGTRRLIRAAFRTARDSIVGKAALESANRRETGATSNERPFYAGQQVKTIRKYSDSWVKILRYIWRTADRAERPKYYFTQRQSECLTHLQSVARPDDEDDADEDESPAARRKRREKAIEDACMTFWIAMFDQELKDSEFKSGIISALAVLGIEAETGNWKTALTYTPILSAVNTVMRALIVYQAWTYRQKRIQQNVEAGMTQEDAEDEAPAVVDGVDKLVERFMTLRQFGGRIHPMDRILHMRTYGLKIRMVTKASGTVSWEGNNILVNKIKFAVDDIRTVVHGLYETTKGRLKELLFIEFDDNLPALDLRRISDNAAELSEGWNFMHDSRNEFPVEGERWMWRRLFNDPVVEDQFVQGSLDGVEGRDDIKWNEKNVKKYFRNVRRFKEELLALVHFSAGAPARATSLLSKMLEWTVRRVHSALSKMLEWTVRRVHSALTKNISARLRCLCHIGTVH